MSFSKYKFRYILEYKLKRSMGKCTSWLRKSDYNTLYWHKEKLHRISQAVIQTSAYGICHSKAYTDQIITIEVTKY